MWTITDKQIESIEADSGSSAVLPCEQIEVTSLNVGTVTEPATPKVLSAKWKDITKEKNEISILKYEEKCFIEIKTEGFAEDDEITLEIKENKENAEILKTINLKIKDNEAQTDTDNDRALVAEEGWLGKQLLVNVTSDKADDFKGEKLNIVCCEHALKRDDEGNLIKELNIKLAGFGEKGNPVPEKKFSEKTENAVKQFQRDYMKVAQTGIVCKHFLEKLDEFCEEYYIKIDTDSKFKVKCPCIGKTGTHNCTDGFGKGKPSRSPLSHTHSYNDGVEIKQVTKSYSGDEKPGIHRSLLWAISSIVYYLDKVETSDNLKIGKFDSSYRCLGNNIDKFTTVKSGKKHPKPNETKDLMNPKYRTSSNHMGNAIDIHIFQNGSRPSNAATNKELCDKVRKLFIKYCGAQIRWEGSNLLNLEPSEGEGDRATTWVHVDCREFNNKLDELYCKTETTLKGDKLIDLTQTSDNKKYEKIDECNFAALQLPSYQRMESLWLGLVKDTNSISFKDNKWTASTSKGNQNNTYRKQNVVEVLEEKGDEYKIKPRGSKSNKEGWVNKKYIDVIFKYLHESK
jgi:hypothetical protein